MKVHVIMKSFKNNDECRKWEEKNLTGEDGRQMYNGETIFMVMHDCKGEEVILTEIWTC